MKGIHVGGGKLSHHHRLLHSFVGHYDGQYLVDDGGSGPNTYGAQCVNVPNEWALWLGIEGFPGNAASFPGDAHPDCDWIANDATNHPHPGDIVVFAASGDLPYGHVDVSLGGDSMRYVGFDQNWPLGSPCGRVVHDYNSYPVAGWYHPRKLG